MSGIAARVASLTVVEAGQLCGRRLAGCSRNAGHRVRALTVRLSEWLRQTGTNIVVQIPRDSRTDALEFGEPFFARLLQFAEGRVDGL